VTTGLLIFFIIVFIYTIFLLFLKERKAEVPVRAEDLVDAVMEIAEETIKEKGEKELNLQERIFLKERLERYFEMEKEGMSGHKLQEKIDSFSTDFFAPEFAELTHLKERFSEKAKKEYWLDPSTNRLLRKGSVLELYGITLWGPFLMWRTEKGKMLIDKLATKRKFWNSYADISFYIVLFAMFSMTLLLIFEAVIVLNIGKENAPSPQLMLGIPGVNPIIPLWYGIIALVVAMVVHEFAHGILTRVGNLKVKSLGVLLCIVPVGAFVEPDQEKLMAAPRRKRDRIFSVGPATNLLVALVFSLLFSWSFMGSIEPEHNGIFVMRVVDEGPADNASVEPGMVILEIDGVRTDTYQHFKESLEGKAYKNVTIKVYDGEKVRTLGPVKLDNRYNYTKEEEDNGTGYMGIYFPYTTEEHKELLQHPFLKGKSLTEKIGNFFYYISLPFKKLSPFPEEFTQHYQVKGFWSFLPENLFWILANTSYWIFWLNLMVGLTNALPAVPLDGGYIFRDMNDKLLEKFKPLLSKEERERIVEKITIYFATFILFLILWQLVGAYVGAFI